MKKNKFHKEERLYKTNDITILFEDGKSFKSSMFNVYWRISESSNKIKSKIVISVPKKIFKSAVTRNNIKRKIREAYRLNKNIILQDLNDKHYQINFILIYIEKSNTCFSTIEAKIILTLYRLKKQIAQYDKENS